MCMGNNKAPEKQIKPATPVAPLPDPQPAPTNGVGVSAAKAGLAIRDRKKAMKDALDGL